MKYKVSELEGALLDAAVAKAQGWSTDKFAEGQRYWLDEDDGSKVCLTEPWMPGVEKYCNLTAADRDGWLYNPSANWALGSPIIERERIATYPGALETGNWYAHYPAPAPHWVGSTPLIAGMRAFVIAKLGEEIDL